MLKTPKFWNSKNIISIALLPFSLINIIIQNIIKITIKSYNPKNIVICIGNINIGGSGKTPTAILIGKILKKEKFDFCYLSSGYGRKSTKDIFIKKGQKIHHKEIGDEVILLSEIGDCYVTNNRGKILKEIYHKNPKTIIIMDDGFQDLSINKDLNIVVIDGNFAFGNKFIFPAGPLREKINIGIKRSDIGFIIDKDKFNIGKKFIKNNKEVIFAISTNNIKVNKDQKYIAFCGIARPEKFFLSIKNKINIIKKISFKDHHDYTTKEIKKLIAKKIKYNAQLITTKKDWVKLSTEHKKQIEYLDYEINIAKNDIKLLIDKILQIIKEK